MHLNFNLLTEEVREFLLDNLHASAAEIVLKKSPFNKVSSKELAEQLVGLQKSKKKLPTWFLNKKVIFPPSLNLEQTSSELTAQYKSELVEGDLLVDVTGGFGIDSYYFSKKVFNVHHCELNKSLQEIAEHNFKALGTTNVKSFCTDGVQHALDTPKVDWLFIDPSRRSDLKGKVFFLKDCLPDVNTVLDTFLKTIPNILIKTAPILDISVGLKELQCGKNIHIVATNNEVKEIVWHITTDFTEIPTIHAVNITNKKVNKLSIPYNAEESSVAKIGKIGTYLYEPFTPVLKAGTFKWLSVKYNVNKLHDHSHLYTNDKLIAFPGKRFKILQVLDFNKKNMKHFVKSNANVVTRNFKLSVAEIRKKFKIGEQKNRFLFFTTNYQNKQIVIECEKVMD